jgi:hypothetical protein
VSTLKRQNDELLMNTVHLEGQLNKSKQKINGTEEQLRKLEHKVSVSDVSIANQVRTVVTFLSVIAVFLNWCVVES